MRRERVRSRHGGRRGGGIVVLHRETIEKGKERGNWKWSRGQGVRRGVVWDGPLATGIYSSLFVGSVRCV